MSVLWTVDEMSEAASDQVSKAEAADLLSERVGRLERRAAALVRCCRALGYRLQSLEAALGPAGAGNGEKLKETQGAGAVGGS